MGGGEVCQDARVELDFQGQGEECEPGGCARGVGFRTEPLGCARWSGELCHRISLFKLLANALPTQNKTQTLSLSPSLSTPTPSIFAFLVLLLSFEGLIVLYWTSLKLIPTLPYFGLLAVGLAWTGRRALGDLRSRRLKREAGEKKSQ